MSAWDGIPQNPERDGWHWVDNRALRWIARQQGWIYTDGGTEWLCSPETAKVRCWTYLGPCLTPAEHAAAVQAERDALLSAIDALERDPEPSSAGEVMAILQHNIRARGDTSALDAAVEAARREERERRTNLMAALNLALCYLFETEPGDSRAVSNEFVAMASIHADEGVDNGSTASCMSIIDTALAAIRARSEGKEGV